MFNLFKVEGKKNYIALIVSIMIALGTGFLSSFLSGNSRGQYESYIKPTFSPPGWVFPVVWTILFILMGIAAYRVWLRGKMGEDVRGALKLYGIQLFLNFLWSILFFRFNLKGLAFFELLVLLVFILLTTFRFYKHDKIAAYLMIPYILWVSFAGVLNYAIWILNE